ncbi:hypothetical protein T01_2396 [Trichinella spiralis]|uniref:Uncharacterized protein n=1 Tax=Trichinella spiralis TaxID=6334 RepID=A0A0V0Z5K9_TRISP|nr:hypothetical protein T01_11412 [Trichinella spiralis]KRY07829.1 hypothetical protein T01_2396 [Trichinella spiralis]
MSGCSVCKLWRVIPPTNIPDLFLCFYAQKSANCSFVLSVTAADMSKPWIFGTYDLLFHRK